MPQKNEKGPSSVSLSLAEGPEDLHLVTPSPTTDDSNFLKQLYIEVQVGHQYLDAGFTTNLLFPSFPSVIRLTLSNVFTPRRFLCHIHSRAGVSFIPSRLRMSLCRYAKSNDTMIPPLRKYQGPILASISPAHDVSMRYRVYIFCEDNRPGSHCRSGCWKSCLQAYFENRTPKT
jgi:hypothetical protein